MEADEWAIISRFRSLIFGRELDGRVLTAASILTDSTRDVGRRFIFIGLFRLLG
jgi:hypothetical protein